MDVRSTGAGIKCLHCTVPTLPLCCWLLIWSMENDTNKAEKITETLANGYSSGSTQRELFNEYQHDRVYMVFKKDCVLVLWTKAAQHWKG